MAARLIKDPETSVREICAALGVSKSTLYRYVESGGEVRGAEENNCERKLRQDRQIDLRDTARIAADVAHSPNDKMIQPTGKTFSSHAANL